MTEAAKSLDPLELPLQGSRLIEASAGTGKTWTISALMLRLVAGHGCEPRSPQQILVMSFTKAATRELAGRIRARLARAAAAMRGDPDSQDSSEDDFLPRLRAAFASGPAREQAAFRLAMAAESMDEAGIFTIDAWCQRMLREHAFESGSLFDETLEPDEAAMRAEAVRDVWRQQVYPLADEPLAAVLDRWKDVDALARDLHGLLDKPIPPEAGEGSLSDRLSTAKARRAQRLLELKAGWEERVRQMEHWLGAVWDDTAHLARKALPARAHATRWLQTLKAWAQDCALEPLELKGGAERLSASALRAGLAQRGLSHMEVPEPFDALQELLTQLKRLPDPAVELRLHLAAAVRSRLQLLKSRAGTFGHADALLKLDEALDPARHGARAHHLRERILARYPVAMIDEFQDTSPLQLRIFDRLYRIADDDPAHTLLLIGDPKQAIYGFRGADIHSYLRARVATAGRHHALSVNHRSTQALVAAVNRLFLGAEMHCEEGAFLFTQPGLASPLPFVEVKAQGLTERLVDAGGPLTPISMVVDVTRGARGDGLPSKEDSRQRLATLCASRIVALLNDPAVGFESDGGPFRRLRPADIAVLVHNRIEAQAVRAQMTQRGLASVYLSDRDSVFDSDEAADLLRLMQATHQPRNLRLARAALATALLGLPMKELLRLGSDDAWLQRQCETLRQLGEAWRSRGILAMVRQALHAFDLPARWLAGDTQASLGERRLTNVLHLAELLQAAAPQARTLQALIDWLREQIEHADQAPGDGEQMLRLESDADRVQVVTIHKAKGLQYPLVFVPFATQFKDIARSSSEERDLVITLPGSASGPGGHELVLSPSADQIQAARKEQRREQLRLFYVAVTRARHALWLGLSEHRAGKGRSSWPLSALGHLLGGAAHSTAAADVEDPHPPDTAPLSQMATQVQAHAAACRDVEVQTVDGADPQARTDSTRLRPRAQEAPLAPARSCTARFERDWTVSSYSQLVRPGLVQPPSASSFAGASGVGASPLHDEPPPGGSLPTRTLREDEPEAFEGGMDRFASDPGAPLGALEVPQEDAEDLAPWHRFPAGAAAGDFLHEQLQWLAGEGFALDGSPDLRKRLRQRCQRPGWSARADDVVAWLREVCREPLPVLGAPLSGLRTAVAEMEFWFPSDGLSLQALDDGCRRHLLPEQPRPALSARTLKGLMMGFADLVFEHQGRYWVLDYKSNRLGRSDSDYSEAAMASAVAQHRYDVQAALYLLALHRLLRARLGTHYDPTLQLGGAICLFLRGIRGPHAGCVALPASPGLIQGLLTLIPAVPQDEGGSVVRADHARRPIDTGRGA